MQPAIDEVHVCCISFDDFLLQEQTFSQHLTIDEKKRADRYYFAKDKKRYIIVRGILRQIISNYLEVAPGKIEFSYSRYGKPAITGVFSDTQLCFNVAHSEKLALFAFTLNREVGVDIEFIRDIPEMEQIIEHFFSDTEKKYFYGLSANMKKEVFFQMWTRKEAFLKATGEGLHRALDTFDVITAPGKFVNLLKSKDKLKTNIISNWYLKDLSTHPGFVAAYAVQGLTKLRWINWSV